MLTPYWDAKRIEAGCDEAGRGCLAGPVFAAAAILPKDFQHPLLNDSKQLDHRARYEARSIVQGSAIAWAVGQVNPAEIDAINILQASFLAMHRALEQLRPQPELLLIDGNRFRPYRNLPFECVIKGDGKLLPIAAASILAKTYRDDYMMQMAHTYPHYGWENNKGYPTQKHRKAIQTHGPCPLHRHSFRLLPDTVQGVLFE